MARPSFGGCGAIVFLGIPILGLIALYCYVAPREYERDHKPVWMYAGAPMGHNIYEANISQTGPESVMPKIDPVWWEAQKKRP